MKAIMVLFPDNGGGGADGGLQVECQQIKEVLGERAAKIIPYCLEDSPEVKMVLGNMVKLAYGKLNGQPENVAEPSMSSEDLSFIKQLRKNLGPVLKEGGKRVWLGSEEYEKRYGKKTASQA